MIAARWKRSLQCSPFPSLPRLVLLLFLLQVHVSFSSSIKNNQINLTHENESSLLRASSIKASDKPFSIDDGCLLKCQRFTHINRDLQEQQDSLEPESPPEEGVNLPFGVQILFIIVLITLSGLFSGLTLGLMSLDKTGLEIVMEGDDPIAAKNAKDIYPIRSNGNLLLTTLLLGNVSVNALLSILMAGLTSGTVGFITSTAVIVVFGEILPQAWCSRYALQVGSKAVPLVRVIICLMYVLAAPLAFALDKLLGRELATTYSKSEMIKLLQIHVEKGMFDQETGVAMTGALKYKDLLVKNVMTTLEHVFMLNADEKLSFDVIAKIFKAGYSRIPVYEVSKNNIIGLLFAKDLIFVDPADEISVKNLVQIFGRGVHVVWPDDTLGGVLRELKTGKSHMALVRDVNNEDDTQDPFYEIKGIITLEDIIEEILGHEIVDETDAFVDPTHSVRVDRDNFDWAKLRLLDAKITDAMLSEDEIKAVTAHLRTNYKDAVALLSDYQLYKFVASTSVSELQTAEQDFGEALPKDLIYEKGVNADSATLILSGKVAVLAGTDNFRSDVSSWSMLAIKSLMDSSYTPDYSAFVSHGPCRCLRFTRERFTAAVDASALERIGSPLMIQPDIEFNPTPDENDNDRVDDLPSPTDINGLPRSNRKHLLKAFRAKNPSDILEKSAHSAENPAKSKDPIVKNDKVERESDSDAKRVQESTIEKKDDTSPGQDKKRENMSPLQDALTAGGSYKMGRKQRSESEKALREERRARRSGSCDYIEFTKSPEA